METPAGACGSEDATGTLMAFGSGTPIILEEFDESRTEPVSDRMPTE